MDTEIKLQQENIKQLLELVKENPGLRIVPFVDTECVPSDDYGSWVAEWGKPTIDEILLIPKEERIYIKSDDYEDLVDRLMCTSDKVLSEIEAEEIVNNYDWEKVIVVRINTPY